MITARSSQRARAVAGTIAQAEALAHLVRDHGHPARVIVGRKRGTIAIRTVEEYRTRGAAGSHWQIRRLPACRATIREWLGY